MARKAKRERQAAAKKRKLGDGSAQPGPSSVTALVPYDPVAAVASVAAATAATGGRGKPAGKEASAASLAKEVAARHPPIVGKRACTFFFGPQKSCRFSAEQCGNGLTAVDPLSG